MLTSIYVGTVIANDDPEFAGRVKIRIEGVTTPVAKESVSYKFVAGDNVGGLTPEQIDISRMSGVWARVMSPIIGESSLGKYNRTRNIASSADVNNPEGMENVGNEYDVEGRQTPPSAQFSRVSDGFTNAPDMMVQKTNTYAYSYMAQGYPNAPKGIYGIPNVGAKVYVQFINGSFRDPVVIGSIVTSTGYKQTFGTNTTAPSYPGVYENSSAAVAVARPEVEPGPAPTPEQRRATRERLLRERADRVVSQARA